MKSVSVSEETHRELLTLKLEEKAKSTDELIHRLIINDRKRRLLAASQMFRQAAKEKGITLKDTLRAGEKARKEIYDEWFGRGD